MSMAPQAIHSNLSRPHPTDSRLLQNLIKGEKSYIDNLAASSHSGYAAASALAAWGTSEAPDISKASQTLSEILASAADAQRTHVQALEGYRSALKDVLDREHSIRSVVRDRDILVGRLIKASKKKVSKKDSGLSQDEKMEKVNAAQRELHACEQVLASEEAALVGVKRRTFKEALTMRMKTMGDAGAAMVDAAKEAILLLDEFDTHGPLLQATGGGQYESMYADDGVETGAYDNQALDQAYYGGQQQPQGMPDQMQADKYGSPIAANGTNLTRDEQGRFHKHLQGKSTISRSFPFLYSHRTTSFQRQAVWLEAAPSLAFGAQARMVSTVGSTDERKSILNRPIQASIEKQSTDAAFWGFPTLTALTPHSLHGHPLDFRSKFGLR